jgi:hypothetical protein
MTHLEIEVHDDEWADFEWLPDDAWIAVGSTISINWTRIRISDPVWQTFVRLKYPWIDWWEVE